MQNPDPRIEEAKALPIGEVAERLGISGLKPAGRERVGPCPVCGGRDRFSLAPDRGVFNCRHCGGGDGIRLVELVQGLEFLGAVAWLVGERSAPLDPAEVERRRRRAERAEKKRTEEAARYRARAIASAREIWNAGQPAEDSPVRAYLERRGIPRAWLPRMPGALRFHPALRYTHKIEGDWRVIHEGPAMLAGVSDVDGAFLGVHRTWIDLDQGDGKALIVHAGEKMAAKKLLGSKKGGVIRLTPPPRDARRTLVMAEGIETTLSALVAAPVPAAAYWCGVDLGNMAGRRLAQDNPKTGKKSVRYSEVPDLADGEAFRPPKEIGLLIYVQDGDSDQRTTRAKLMAGLARARHFAPALRTMIVHAGEGVDLNDLVKGAAP